MSAGPYTLHDSKPVRSPAESLEVEIERAWVRLTSVRWRRPRTLYLTARGTIAGLGYDARILGEEIGTYTNQIRLKDFRDDVFDAFERTRRAA